MISIAKNPAAYIASLSGDRKESIENLRRVILKNLPKGFQEEMSYGMIGYVVPHSTYPKGYHCNPKLPLPFLSIAAQKNFIALYHMGIYAKKDLLEWFQAEFPKYAKKKLDMGKSCVRFKDPQDIPYDLIAQLCKKMTPSEWISTYEQAFQK